MLWFNINIFGSFFWEEISIQSKKAPVNFTWKSPAHIGLLSDIIFISDLGDRYLLNQLYNIKYKIFLFPLNLGNLTLGFMLFTRQ